MGISEVVESGVVLTKVAAPPPMPALPDHVQVALLLKENQELHETIIELRTRMAWIQERLRWVAVELSFGGHRGAVDQVQSLFESA